MLEPQGQCAAPIRVLIVDDHSVVRSGLGAFLSVYDDLELVGEAGSGEEVVALCASANPDVVLMDLVMPGMDGADATAAIRVACPAVQVIALTSFPEDNLVNRALQAGAIAYLLKNVSAADLAEAIRAAHSGRSTLAPEAAAALIRTTKAGPRLGHDLTVREREVLQLMCEGMSNSQIARALVVSDATAKFHVSKVLAKLQASSRTEAVAVALQEGILAR